MQPSASFEETNSSPIAARELFALSDEQILEIEPEGQVQVANVPPPRGVDSSASENQGNGAAKNVVTAPGTASASPPSHEPVTSGDSAQPPKWLAERMRDPWSGEEASAFWNDAQQTKQEAAAYRTAFATPEDARALKELYPGGVSEARTAAERARELDVIDRAFFGGAGNSAEQISAGRTELAQRMMRENPAAFREMVEAGLKLFENVTEARLPNGQEQSQQGTTEKANSTAVSATPGARLDRNASDSKASPTPASVNAHSREQNERLAAYTAFEKAANDELERSVGGAIDRALQQALPNAERAGGGALKGRLNATIHQEIEKALQNDRQLGEQVAQILASRRLDEQARAQVVRLIDERAQQLAPGATKRVIAEWTQTTLAAHRAGNRRTDEAASQRELTPAANSSVVAPEAPRAPANKDSRPLGRNDIRAGKPAKFDYRKLSDEQILEM